ncbi:riboflavin synthase [Proteocatella sphenisci]|uniref:riboflavin synthase n=1 Tax=Proteocatella sphenisci TaxID=181070 RepID=UPI00048F31FC|nr:riboflavin synthase [Proteocatella sphenisci]
MFTGIIEETGKIIRVEKSTKSSRLSIEGKLIFDDLKLGDSVAVNGVCLTVSNMGSGIFVADVMSETVSRSSLGMLRAGSKVNLERAMPANGRFGGHIVSGHIDGTGTIAALRSDENAVWITISISEKISRYIVEKGSVAIDGISLTVAQESPGKFSVSVIPHTGKETTLLKKKVGDIVNIENDVIGKYIERFTGYGTGKGPDLYKKSYESNITEDFIMRSGF